jgi:hypothetical protein
VVVVAALLVALEPRLRLEHQLVREPRLLQELQRSVESGAPDVATALLDELEEVVDREVPLGAQEGPVDDLALLAALEAVSGEEGGKDFLFLAPHVVFRLDSRLAAGIGGVDGVGRA